MVKLGGHRRPVHLDGPFGITTRIAFRSLMANPVRTALSIAGVACSSLLLTAILISAVTVHAAMLAGVRAHEGSWQVKLGGLSSAGAEEVLSSAQVAEASTVHGYGNARVSSADLDQDAYLGVVSWPEEARSSGEAGESALHGPSMREGRAPRDSTEIVLPRELKGEVLSDRDGDPVADGGLEVGSTITVALGQRVYDGDDEPSEGEGWGPGTLLTTDDYFITDTSGHVAEHLSDAAPARTFTVTGFFEYDPAWSNGPGWLGLTRDDGGIDPRSTAVYLSLRDVGDADSFRRAVSALAGSPQVAGQDGVGPISTALLAQGFGVSPEFHHNLISVQGLDGGGWATGPRVVVGALCVVAAVSSGVLVSNVLSISARQRVRDYGLLASVGATRRQLVHTMVAEASLVGTAGIPLGILAGVAASWAVFRLAGEGVGSLLTFGYGYAAEVSGIVVAPWAVALAVAISAASLLASAVAPAWRVGRVSAVGAACHAGEVPGGRRTSWLGARLLPIWAALARIAPAGRERRLPACLLERARRPHVSAVSLLARRNVQAAGARGRAAVVSLALSVALLITCGTLSTYLLGASAESGRGTADLQAYASRRAVGSETVGDVADSVERLAAQARAIDCARLIGLSAEVGVAGKVPASMVVADGASAGDPWGDGLLGSDGSYQGFMDLVFLDRASWGRYVDRLGLDPSAYTDPAHPRAIGLNVQTGAYGAEGSVRRPFSSTGAVDLFLDVASPEGCAFYAVSNREGRADADALFYRVDNATSDDVRADLMGSVRTSYRLEVAALADTAPEAAPSAVSSSRPALILPLTALPVLAGAADASTVPAGATADELALAHPLQLVPVAAGGASNDLSLTLQVAVAGEDRSPAAVERAREGTERFLDELPVDAYRDQYLYNAAEDSRQDRMRVGAVTLFSGCFSVVTGVIAVANVFNTVSASMIARRREFAVLRSLGMAPAAFRRMVVRECASYAARGLILGFALAGALVWFLTTRSLSLYWGQVALTPWPWAALSVLLASAVLAGSARYALARDRGVDIISILREDA